MGSFHIGINDLPYVKTFFTDRGIAFTYTELEHSYEITIVSDEDSFILKLHGGWEAVICHIIEARKHNDLIRSIIGVTAK